MEEGKDKIVKLEERLEKAAATFKEMKAENEKLQARVTELEDELTLNGGAIQEVEGLKGRLEKAKEIFTTQKTKIAELNTVVEEKDQMLKEVQSDLEDAAKTCSELTERVHALEDDNSNLKSILERVREIVGK